MQTATMELSSLLNDLKYTVEGLLSVPTANIWSVYGGLKRLSLCVENILNHKLKYSQTTNQKSSLDFHQFIKSLHWLNPMLVPAMDKIKKSAQQDSITEGQAWIKQSLQSHTMSAQLKALVNNRQYLLTCYNDNAFLCQSDYFEALCKCLEAVEQNSPSLLLDIDHSLLLGDKEDSQTFSRSRRTQSDLSKSTQSIDPLTNQLVPSSVALKRTESHPRLANNSSSPYLTSSGPLSPRVTSPESLKLDFILNEDQDITENKPAVEEMQQTSPRVDKGKQPMKRSSGHQRSKSDMSFVKGLNVPVKTAESNTRQQESSYLSSSLPSHEKYRGASIDDNGWHVVVPSTETYFPQPRQGESLKSFLASQDFDTCAELDRENAHFAISEALIAAIEQMKWNHVLRPAPTSELEDRLEDSEIDTDEEFILLKQKIKEKRRLKYRKKNKLISDRTSDGATPKSSSHSNSTPRDSDSLFSEEDEMNRLSLSDTDSLLTLRDGLTISDRLSLDSSGAGSYILSAEQVALSLLSQFNEYHLPKADELVWLVPWSDAPQRMLPLPDSLPISPDDMIEGRISSRIRGNAEWAPPRAQIIFNIHPTPKRKILVAKQNYRCAGCGMKIEEGFIKRFRYCEYLGKYFCQCCHTNQMSVIPARVLHKWDFTKYQVSNFAHDLLERLSGEAIFNVLDVNKDLLKKSRSIQRVTIQRLRLRHSRLFIASCRLATECSEKLSRLPAYLMEDIYVYSLDDLIKTKAQDMEKELTTLADQAVDHILHCELCKAKGFICELCNNEADIIFPFQLEQVSRCNVCQTCYHSTCYTKVQKSCPKCVRIEYRRQKSQNFSPS